MDRRLLLTGALGGLAIFLWSAIAHMALPLGEAGIKQVDAAKERGLLNAMQVAFSGPGFYMFPRLESGTDQARYQRQVATGPSGILIYYPARQFSFGKSLAIEFGSELAQALVVVYLLSLTRIATFSGRLGFYVVAGLIAAIATNVSYWTWYGFPTTYTLVYMVTNWIGYLCAGLVSAVMKAGSADRAAAAAG